MRIPHSLHSPPIAIWLGPLVTAIAVQGRMPKTCAVNLQLKFSVNIQSVGCTRYKTNDSASIVKLFLFLLSGKYAYARTVRGFALSHPSIVLQAGSMCHFPEYVPYHNYKIVAIHELLTVGCPQVNRSVIPTLKVRHLSDSVFVIATAILWAQVFIWHIYGIIMVSLPTW